jgi:hypothetical protein
MLCARVLYILSGSFRRHKIMLADVLENGMVNLPNFPPVPIDFTACITMLQRNFMPRRWMMRPHRLFTSNASSRR